MKFLSAKFYCISLLSSPPVVEHSLGAYVGLVRLPPGNVVLVLLPPGYVVLVLLPPGDGLVRVALVASSRDEELPNVLLRHVVRFYTVQRPFRPTAFSFDALQTLPARKRHRSIISSSFL